MPLPYPRPENVQFDGVHLAKIPMPMSLGRWSR